MKFFKSISIVIITICGVLFTAGEVIFYLMSNRKGNVDFLFNGEESDKNKKIRLNREADLAWLRSQPLEQHEIISADGLKLKATLLRANTPTNRYVLAIHGYRATGHKEFDSISRFYHNLGLNVFMIDHRASGKSEGKYITYGAKENEDCMLWLSYMRKTFGEDIKIILHGCSMGSATVMMLCGKLLPNNVVFAVADCGYATLKSQLYHNFCDYKMPPRLCYFLYKLFAKIHGDFDADSVNPVLALENCKIPVIFAHGEDDNFVPFNMVYAVYDSCPNPQKRLITTKGAEHVQSFQLSTEFKDAIKEYISNLM